MNRDLESEIQVRIQAFAQEMSTLMRQAAMEAMEDALGGGTGTRRARATPAAKAKGTPGRKPKAGKKAPAAKKRRGGKRTAAELLVLEEEFLKEVKKAGGRRVEEIGKAMGVSTKDLALPVKKLLSDKKIKTTGKRRATRYFAR